MQFDFAFPKMKTKAEMLQDPTANAVLRTIYGLSSTGLSELYKNTKTEFPDCSFDIIQLMQNCLSGVVDSLMDEEPKLRGISPCGENKGTEFVDTIFDLFSEEIEDHLEIILFETFKKIFPNAR